MSDDYAADLDPSVLAIFEQLQPFLEMLRGIVATFTAEGYTDSEARTLAVSIVTTAGKAAS